jgi:hypothetical protein
MKDVRGGLSIFYASELDYERLVERNRRERTMQYSHPCFPHPRLVGFLELYGLFVSHFSKLATIELDFLR